MSARWNHRGDDIDLREGFAAVASYMNPLRDSGGIRVEEHLKGEAGQYILLRDDYFIPNGLYYLDYIPQGDIYVVLDDGERMRIHQALQERQVLMQSLVAGGLQNVHMVPLDNPLNGEFTIAHHQHTFTLNGELFYPNLSFMYVRDSEPGMYFGIYYDSIELELFLRWYGYEPIADVLRTTIRANPKMTTASARNSFISETDLIAMGIEARVKWETDSQTIVEFIVSDTGE